MEQDHEPRARLTKEQATLVVIVHEYGEKVRKELDAVMATLFSQLAKEHNMKGEKFTVIQREGEMFILEADSGNKEIEEKTACDVE